MKKELSLYVKNRKMNKTIKTIKDTLHHLNPSINLFLKFHLSKQNDYYYDFEVINQEEFFKLFYYLLDGFKIDLEDFIFYFFEKYRKVYLKQKRKVKLARRSRGAVRIKHHHLKRKFDRLRKKSIESIPEHEITEGILSKIFS